MKRETTTFATLSGKQFEVKNYLTGREMNEIKRDMYGAIKVNMNRVSEGANAVSDLPATFMIDRERKLLEVAVVSFMGEATNIVDRLQDLPNAEYQEVLAKVTEIVQPDFQTSK